MTLWISPHVCPHPNIVYSTRNYHECMPQLISLKPPVNSCAKVNLSGTMTCRTHIIWLILLSQFSAILSALHKQGTLFSERVWECPDTLVTLLYPLPLPGMLFSQITIRLHPYIQGLAIIRSLPLPSLLTLPKPHSNHDWLTKPNKYARYPKEILQVTPAPFSPAHILSNAKELLCFQQFLLKDNSFKV